MASQFSHTDEVQVLVWPGTKSQCDCLGSASWEQTLWGFPSDIPPPLGLAPRLHARVSNIPKSLLDKETWVYQVTRGVGVVLGPQRDQTSSSISKIWWLWSRLTYLINRKRRRGVGAFHKQCCFLRLCTSLTCHRHHCGLHNTKQAEWTAGTLLPRIQKTSSDASPGQAQGCIPAASAHAQPAHQHQQKAPICIETMILPLKQSCRGTGHLLAQLPFVPAPVGRRGVCPRGSWRCGQP